MKRRLAALLCTVALFASACGGTASPQGQAGGAGDTLIIGGPLEPRTLNPAVQSGMVTALPGAQLFASPIRYGKDFTPLPYLAKSWEFSADQLSLTLHLVSGATFHDGTPITSADVAFSLETVKKYHSFGTAMFGSVSSVETPDKETAVIKLSKPTPALLLSMSPALLPIIPKHVYGDGQDLAKHPRNVKDVVGSGPFKLKEFTAGNRIVLERNDSFFLQDRAKLKQLIVKFYPNSAATTTALEAGEIGMEISYDPVDAARLAKNSKLTVATSGYEAAGALNWLELNTKNQYLKDLKVRQAVAHAVDVDFIVNQLHSGIPEVAPGPIHPGSPFFSKDLVSYNHDTAKAAALLDEAGFPAKAGGTRFSLRIDYNPGNDVTGKNVAEAIASQLGKVGIKVEVRNAPDFATWSERVSKYDFDLTVDTVYNWGDPTIGVSRTYVCDNIKPGVVWVNMAQYCNPAVDQLFASAAQEMDVEKRKQLYRDVQRQITTDLPVVYIETQPIVNIYSKAYTGMPDGIWGAMAPLLEATGTQAG
ncbi:ABC transporter substrate-binding protein [Dactylosporangium fulvum]|uniref:ABC transporter substrate-binding protein n=1 Tax=Dactylosporangium fulvum TaxID=53359 RepID=A0ABY5W815_9ACTN|nr:ABC transporter substrate-binding protein [Dactylosporangium fulvum]UWP85369.1 ABC transporter substrate-binding protein [Dactylosporangium fulvum]